MWEVLVVIFSAIFLVALLFFLCNRKVFPILRRRCARKGSLKAEKLTLRRFQMEELRKATKNFSDECLLGRGGFGNVYKGAFEVEGTLAIKRAHAASFQSLEEFRNEVRLLSKVKHQNLVSLVGFCEESGEKGARVLVYEYVANGSLLEYIMGKKETTLSWRQRVNIAIGAAKGIAHLHTGIKPSIIHRDIKPSNILIGDGFEAKVSDFGLVKSGPDEDQSHVSSLVKGTPGYLDPAYCSSFHLSPFSDVYSFGVILLQLVTARPAVDSFKNKSNFHIIDWARSSIEKGNIEEILDVNLLSELCNKEMMLKMGKLGLQCVAKSPKDRPTMAQVLQELDDALYSVDHIGKQTARNPRRLSCCQSSDNDISQSLVSIDGVRFQKFRVEMDSVSFQSTSLRCFEAKSVSIDIEDNNALRGICKESKKEEEENVEINK